MEKLETIKEKLKESAPFLKKKFEVKKLVFLVLI